MITSRIDGHVRDRQHILNDAIVTMTAAHQIDPGRPAVDADPFRNLVGTAEPVIGPRRPTAMRRRRSLFTPMVMTGLFTVLAGCGSGSDSPTTTGSGDPITVSQLLVPSADTPVAVQGLLHIDRGVARLCGAVLESHPPQCGEPSVELVGLDSSAVQGASTAQGVTWKEGVVLNLERAADGRFSIVGIEAWSDVQVVLGLYSGVPDPAWTLTADQSKELSAALAGLSRVDEGAPPGGLGYHGFTIVTPDGKMVAYASKVLNADSDPPYVLDDPDRTIERFLLDTAGQHVPAEVLDIVADAFTRE